MVVIIFNYAYEAAQK